MIHPSALLEGDLELLGEMPWASNYTFLALLPEERRVIYKPQRGEAPLWDFPSGTLCRREVAAFLLSEHGGWGFVPPTVLREGPLGLGAVQLFIEHDPGKTAFEMIETHTKELRRIALFDLLVNNADRKAGHVLLDPTGRVWAVDHGICFHSDPKLRTVIWEFAGEEILDEERRLILATSVALDDPAAEPLKDLLGEEEIESLCRRAAKMLGAELFPEPGPGRAYPWPPV